MTSGGSGASARKRPTRQKPARKKAIAKKPPAPKRLTKKQAAAKKKPARRQVAQKTVTYSLTPQTKGGGPERRIDERCSVGGLLEVAIELFGYQRDSVPFGVGRALNTAQKFHSVGRTVNLSVSGLLARVADVVPDGSNCLVRFVNAGDGVRPELRWGVVVRCSELESGKYEIAVHFDNPLEHLDVKALDAR